MPVATVMESLERRSLREQVDKLLPTWQSWYPSLFDAAADLGLIRARVCSPSSLLLSRRHAEVQSEALRAFKEHWLVEDEPEPPRLPIRLQRGPNLQQKPNKLQKPHIKRRG
ncbi:MAG: hypothetical protein ACREUC_06215 [Steroidobacteraceae bacterium]